MKILVTGCAGFIGYHLSKKLLQKKIEVFGIDNINDYYDISLKKDRLKNLKKYKNFYFYKYDLVNLKNLNNLIKKNKIKYVVHLAAQAGVRYSIQNPHSYFRSNLEGFFNILEVCKTNKIKHLIFASTSSVYGNSKKFPLKESDNTDNPLSFYAATKKSNEVMAHSYSYLYKLPCTGVRFFTVYGPYGRPDMALFKFTKNIIKNYKIDLFNYGKHIRDFTYIDDVVNALEVLVFKPSKTEIPYNIFNIGNGKPEKLLKYLRLIEKNLSKKAKISNYSIQLGDVYKTHASIMKLKKYVTFNPKFKIESGIKKFIKWYLEYYKLK